MGGAGRDPRGDRRRHRVVLGSGRPLFDELDAPLECDLLEQASFDDGVVLHRWAIRR